MAASVSLFSPQHRRFNQQESASRTDYGILKKYDMQGDNFEWARRTTIVFEKEGKIQHVEFDESAVNPKNVMAVCTDLHEKHAK